MTQLSSSTCLQERFSTNINNILGIEVIDSLGIAVSGGCDSVALLYLTAKWAELNKVKVTVFTVDHRLRAESVLETLYVKRLASKFKFRFVLLSLAKSNKITAIQSTARKVRYNFMSMECRKYKIPLLLTAHHFDDMLESYLIKKSKKASSLALLPNITCFWNDVWILRPLFNIEKKELIEYLLKNRITWFEDKSNKSNKYERNRVRNNLAIVSKLEKEKLISNYNLSIEKAKLENQKLIESLAEVVSIFNYGFAKINISRFNKLEVEIKIHIINYILTVVSGKETIPRYRNVRNIIMHLLNKEFRFCTLNYCKLSSKSGELILFKEKVFVNIMTSKIDNLTHQNIEEKETAIQTVFYKLTPYKRSFYTCYWDNRFEIIINKSGYYVSNLRIEDYIVLKMHLNLKDLARASDNNHKLILFTLPVIRNLEKVVAIPHISYYDTELTDNKIKVIFRPNFISRFTHFF